MTPQDKSREAFEKHYLGFHHIDSEDFTTIDGQYRMSYVHRDYEKWQAAEAYGRTEQAAEIAALEAQLVEVMPLAKFGAEITKLSELTTVINPEHIADLLRQTGCHVQSVQGDMLHYKFVPNIEATIKQLSKG